MKSLAIALSLLALGVVTEYEQAVAERGTGDGRQWMLDELARCNP